MILEQSIDNYKIPLATQLWTIEEFDDKGAIIALANVTEESTDISQRALVVFTPTMENDKYVGGTPHYISVGNTVYGDDGYCDEFLSNAEEALKNLENSTLSRLQNPCKEYPKNYKKGTPLKLWIIF